MATIITSNQQRIAFVDRAGLVTKEWLGILKQLAEAGADVTALTAALAAATASITALQTQAEELDGRIDLLEGAASEETDEVSIYLHMDGKMRAIAEESVRELRHRDAPLMLMMDARIRAIVQEAVRGLEPPNSASAVLMNRSFNPSS